MYKITFGSNTDRFNTFLDAFQAHCEARGKFLHALLDIDSPRVVRRWVGDNLISEFLPSHERLSYAERLGMDVSEWKD